MYVSWPCQGISNPFMSGIRCGNIRRTSERGGSRMTFYASAALGCEHVLTIASTGSIAL